jgi:outer membrane protein assembly factor BamB
MWVTVIAGCGGNSRDTPSYDSGNVGPDWVDRTRGDSNDLVAYDDTVCSTHAHELFCLDALSGDEIFAEQLPGTATSPALAADRLVVGDDSGPGGMLYGYSLDGRQLWSLPLDGHDVRPWQSQPGGHLLVAGNVVVWGRGTGPSQELVAVHVASGREHWRLPVADLGAVYADGHRLYTTNDHDELVAVDPRSGAQVWRAQIGEGASDSVVLGSVLDGAGVAVAVDGEPGRVVVLDAGSGASQWDQVLDAETTANVSTASANGVVYINDDDFLTAYDETGDRQWFAPAAGGRLGPSTPLRLVAEHGRLFTIGDSVWDVSRNGGAGTRVREDVHPSDIAVVEDHVIIAGAERLEAVPLVQR